MSMGTLDLLSPSTPGCPQGHPTHCPPRRVTGRAGLGNFVPAAVGGWREDQRVAGRDTPRCHHPRVLGPRGHVPTPPNSPMDGGQPAGRTGGAPGVDFGVWWWCCGSQACSAIGLGCWGVTEGAGNAGAEGLGAGNVGQRLGVQVMGVLVMSQGC